MTSAYDACLHYCPVKSWHALQMRQQGCVMVRHSDLANVEVSGQSLTRPRVLGLALEQALKAFLVGASLPPACATVVFGLV